MKKLVLILLLLTGCWQTSVAQTGFSFDSIANPPYICQAHTFTVEVFGWRADGSTQNGAQHYYFSNDTVYVQFHFVSGIGPAVPTPLYRSLVVPMPPNFGRYKIVAQGWANGQVYQTLTSAISICSGLLASPEPAAAEKDFQVYPNPTTGQIEVAFPSEAGFYDLKVTNTAGQVVGRAKTATGRVSQKIALGHLPAGIYFLQATSLNHAFTRKIIKH